jgi:hypothetical protein
VGEIPDLYEGAGREGCDSQEGGAEKGNAEALNDRERRHSEVGAPARQDLGSLRNMSRRPGTATSNPVLGLVVTALPKTIPKHHQNFTLTSLKSLKSS